MAKKQQRFTQRPTVFEPTEAEIDAVLHDVFTAMDAAEADRLAREEHALAMLATESAEEQNDAFICPECGGYFGSGVSYSPSGYDICPVCHSELIPDDDYDWSDWEPTEPQDFVSERAQVVEDALREDAEREGFDSWRTNHDVPIPFEITPLGEEIARQNENDARHCGRPVPLILTEKGIATFQPYAATILRVRALRKEGRL